MRDCFFLDFICVTHASSCDRILKAYRKKNQKKVQNTSESTQDRRGSPALTNGNDDVATMPGSKYQQKKAKKQAKKQAKVNACVQHFFFLNNLFMNLCLIIEPNKLNSWYCVVSLW